MPAQRPSRRSSPYAERVLIPFSNAALTASATVKGYPVPAGRELIVERVTYWNQTGLASGAANTFKCEVKKGATTVATAFNTDTASTGPALPAAAWVAGVLSPTLANQWLAETDSLDVVFTLTGVQTLPAGNGVIEARLY